MCCLWSEHSKIYFNNSYTTIRQAVKSLMRLHKCTSESLLVTYMIRGQKYFNIVLVLQDE